MQTLTQLKELLSSAGRDPVHRFGQNFLIDANLMAKLLELADIRPGQNVLEVGPATGSLTEELLARAGRVVAVEIDDHLAELLRQRLGGNSALTVLNRDVLSGKHQIAPEVLGELKPLSPIQLVSNLPYNVAVPFLMNCLELSWRHLAGGGCIGGGVRFESLTFTVQREMAQRLVAPVGDDAYGPISVLVALLARATAGRILPAEAFWPRPKVQSQMVRLEFSPAKAAQVKDFDTLSAVLSATFGHRRKKIGSAAKHRDCPFSGESFALALHAAGIDPDLRPEQVPPEAFGALANAL